MLEEEEVLKEFNKLLNEKIDEYTSKYGTPDLNKTPPNIFIKDKVWDSEVKYHRMMMITKQKFFEALKSGESIEKYEKDLKKLWGGIDRTYMTKAIEELRLMIMARDIKNAKATQRSIKLENFWQEYEQGEKEIYQLNPERDFRTIENRYVNRHVNLYKNWSNEVDIVDNIESLMKRYDNMDKTIPYYSHKTGEIIRYVDISTYNSMLYNVNLLHSAWNRTAYDSKLLGNNLWYLPAHTFACPGCAYFQGYVYAERGASPQELLILKRYGHPSTTYVDQVLEDDSHGATVGHPNCKHNWTLFWSEDQVQEEKYNDEEWEEKYKDRQKIQSLTLQKSRLLTDRRIYKEVGREDLVDKTTAKIKHLREKIKELQ